MVVGLKADAGPKQSSDATSQIEEFVSAARIRKIKRTAGHGITCVLLPDFRAMSAVLVKPPADTAIPAGQGLTDAKNASFRLICRNIVPGGVRLCECAPEENKKGARCQPLTAGRGKPEIGSCPAPLPVPPLKGRT